MAPADFELGEELLEFPCTLIVKAIGRDEDDFEARVVAAVRREVPDLGEAAVTTRPSRNGNFLSVSLEVHATSRPHLTAIYEALRSIPGVSYLL